jgi:hypothetical protein
MSGSASFQRVRKSLKAARALAVSPCNTRVAGEVVLVNRHYRTTVSSDSFQFHRENGNFPSRSIPSGWGYVLSWGDRASPL